MKVVAKEIKDCELEIIRKDKNFNKIVLEIIILFKEHGKIIGKEEAENITLYLIQKSSPTQKTSRSFNDEFTLKHVK